MPQDILILLKEDSDRYDEWYETLKTFMEDSGFFLDIDDLKDKNFYEWYQDQTPFIECGEMILEDEGANFELDWAVEPAFVF